MKKQRTTGNTHNIKMNDYTHNRESWLTNHEMAWWHDQIKLLGKEGLRAKRLGLYDKQIVNYPYLVHQEGLGLDVGCGPISVFESSDKNIIAVDVLINRYGEIVDLSDKIKYINIVDENLPFDDSLFDYVWCHNVIDHTPDEPLLMSEMIRVLRPGGIFYFHVYLSKEKNGHYSIWNKERIEAIPLIRLQEKYDLNPDGAPQYSGTFIKAM